MNISETQKLVWKGLHTTVGLIMLAVVGLFVYEKNIVHFNHFVDVVSIVPAKSEFESGDDLDFYIFAQTDSTQPINVRQSLLCDRSDGNGYKVVDAQDKMVYINPHDGEDVVVAKTLIQNSTVALSFEQITDRLSNIVEASSISNSVTYSSSLPTTTSQCFMKFQLTKETDYFKISKQLEVQSYPFDYVRYYSFSEE